MTCKAFNGRCVAAWLADRAVSLLERDPTNVEHQLVAGCLNHECNRVGVPVNRNFANMSGPFCLQGPGAIISYVQWSKQEDICRALRTRFPCLPQPTGLESIPLGTCHLPNGFGMFVKTIRSQEEATNILLHGLRYLNFWNLSAIDRRRLELQWVQIPKCHAKASLTWQCTFCSSSI